MSDGSGGVVVDAAAMRAAFTLVVMDASTPGGPVFDHVGDDYVEFHVSSAPPGIDALEAFRAAVAEANIPYGSVEEEEVAEAGRPFRAPGGPTAFFKFSLDGDALERWAATVAARLTEAGFVGTLLPRHSEYFPEWCAVRSLEIGPAAHLVMPPGDVVSDPQMDLSAFPDALRGAFPASLRDWLLALDGDVWVTVDAYTASIHRDARFLDELFADLAGEYYAQSAEVLGPTQSSYRRVATALAGPLHCQVVDDRATLQERLDQLSLALVRHADRLLLGFVRTVPRLVLGWSSLTNVYPFPGPDGHLVERRAVLLDRFVPDVHGIQVLTDAHLARLTDRVAIREAWEVEPLGNGRHLLTARDLSAWYAQPLPDPATLAAARELFASLILPPPEPASSR